MSKKIFSIITILVMFLLICVNNVYAASDSYIGTRIFYGIVGDLNLDQKITDRDLTSLENHINKGSYITLGAKKRGDVNKDGKLDKNDISILKKYLNNLNNIKSIKISSDKKEIKRWQTITLTAETNPKVENVKISWSSSKPLKLAKVIGTDSTFLSLDYGEVEVIAKVGNVEGKYKINIKDDEIAKIEIKNTPKKLEYNIGEKIDKTGLTIKAISKDGNTEKTIIATNQFTLTPDTATKAGEQKIKVTYSGKSAYFTVTAGSLGTIDGTNIDTATSMPETMENSTDYWKVKIQKGMLHNNINQQNKAYKTYNTQSIALFYANRILGADIDANELNIYMNKTKSTAYWAKGNFEYNSEYGTFENQLKTIYAELIKGYPVLVKVKDENCNTKYVVAYGVTKTNKPRTKLSAIDFQTIDPSDGNGKPLSEYYQYTENGAPVYALVTFNENAIKNIEITGNTSIAVNSTAQLTAIVKNTGDAEIKIPKLKEVTWSISKNGTNATISNEGLVTAGSKLGSPKVTVKSKANSSVKEDLNITICNPKTPFTDIAYDLKKQCYNNGIKYDTGIISDLSKETPITRGSIDCSMYVSWVLYEYGKANNLNDYKNNFKHTKDCSGMINWFNNNNKVVKKVGSLEANAKKLQPGDIIIKSSHVEIFAYYSNGSRYVYNCGSDDAISNSNIITYGASSSSTSGYTVYRLTK